MRTLSRPLGREGVWPLPYAPSKPWNHRSHPSHIPGGGVILCLVFYTRLGGCFGPRRQRSKRLRLLEIWTDEAILPAYRVVRKTPGGVCWTFRMVFYARHRAVMCSSRSLFFSIVNIMLRKCSHTKKVCCCVCVLSWRFIVILSYAPPLLHPLSPVVCWQRTKGFEEEEGPGGKDISKEKGTHYSGHFHFPHFTYMNRIKCYAAIASGRVSAELPFTSSVFSTMHDQF